MLTISDISDEVMSGLRNEREGLHQAQVNQDFYDGQGHKWLQARDAEDPQDFGRRRKRFSMLTQEVVGALTRHLYNPGPTRKLEGNPAADEWLQALWAALDYNTLWQEADALSTLNDWCAFQVAGGDDPDKPLDVKLWGREELVVWTDPDDATKPAVVCTIDKYDQKTRYRVWDAAEYAVYETEKFDPNKQSSNASFGKVTHSVAPRLAVPPTEHGYGELPFAFVHARPPVRCFDTPGIGTAIRRVNAEIDAMLCDLAEAVQFYALPWLVGTNLPAGWRPIVKAGRVVRLEPDRTVAELGQQPPEPMLQALTIPVDTAALWEDLNNQIDHALENFGVPKAAVRMTQQTAASGAAIIQEQMPLIERARGRRPMFTRFERSMAGLLLRVGGVWWNRPDLYEAGKSPELTLSWPEPQIDAPGQERDATDQAELELGITSRIELIMRRRGVSRDQAEQMLMQYAKDEQVFTTLFPTGGPMTPPSPEPMPGAPTDGQGQAQDPAATQGQAQADGVQGQAQG